MRKILTYGTFDLMHYGHIKILKRAKEQGDYLVVGVSSDKFNESKGKKAIHSLEERIEMLEAIKFVDKIIVEDTWEQKINDIEENDIDLFLMGDDWNDKFDYLKKYCEVKYLPRTKDISSTAIKKIIEDENEK